MYFAQPSFSVFEWCELNLSFVKYEYTVGKNVARNSRKIAIYYCYSLLLRLYVSSIKFCLFTPNRELSFFCDMKTNAHCVECNVS